MTLLPFDDPISTREIAQHLRRMIDAADSTPEHLAARIGVSRATVAAWLYGRNLDKVACVLAAFEALGCVIKILPPRHKAAAQPGLHTKRKR